MSLGIITTRPIKQIRNCTCVIECDFLFWANLSWISWMHYASFVLPYILVCPLCTETMKKLSITTERNFIHNIVHMYNSSWFKQHLFWDDRETIQVLVSCQSCLSWTLLVCPDCFWVGKEQIESDWTTCKGISQRVKLRWSSTCCTHT